MSHSASTPSIPLNAKGVSVVKYSLPELLAELKLERETGALAQEKLQQDEIAKIFHAQPKRRRLKRPA